VLATAGWMYVEAPTMTSLLVDPDRIRQAPDNASG
jgi:hypothetical protein